MVNRVVGHDAVSAEACSRSAHPERDPKALLRVGEEALLVLDPTELPLRLIRLAIPRAPHQIAAAQRIAHRQISRVTGEQGAPLSALGIPDPHPRGHQKRSSRN